MSDHDRVEIVFQGVTGTGIRINAIRAGHTYRNQGRAAEAGHLIAALAGHVRPRACAPRALVEAAGFRAVEECAGGSHRYRRDVSGGVFELTLEPGSTTLAWTPGVDGCAGAAREIVHLDRTERTCWPTDLDSELDHAAIALRMSELYAGTARAAA